MPADNKVDRIAREIETLSPHLNLRERRRRATLIAAAIDTAWSPRTARSRVEAHLRELAPGLDGQLDEATLRVIAACGRHEWSTTATAASAARWRRWFDDPEERFRMISRRLADELPHLETDTVTAAARALAKIEPGTRRLRVDIRTGDYTTGRRLGEIAADVFAGPELDSGSAVTVTVDRFTEPADLQQELAERFAAARSGGHAVMLWIHADGPLASTTAEQVKHHPTVPTVVISPTPLEGTPTAAIDIPEPTPEGVVRLLQHHLDSAGAATLRDETADRALALARVLPLELWAGRGNGELFVRTLARRIAADGADTPEQVQEAVIAELAQWSMPILLDEDQRRDALRIRLTTVLTAHTAKTIDSLASVAARMDPLAPGQRLLLTGPPGSGRSVAARVIGSELARLRGGQVDAVIEVDVRETTPGDELAVRVRAALITAERDRHAVLIEGAGPSSVANALEEHPQAPVIVIAEPRTVAGALNASLPPLDPAGAERLLVARMSRRIRTGEQILVDDARAEITNRLRQWSASDFDTIGNARGIVELARDILSRQITHAHDDSTARWPIQLRPVAEAFEALQRRAGIDGRQ
ncbi:hypothetical protein ACT17_34535 [Mycolicibacterium conceptionense]|uniref:Uncharacterized protein n=1 Tax=Mycolicibacterium conceptionense TaxID=451644 RepID=A0A0J8TVX6_9MYCO|nr:hypothetical protein [Mycolicibacterium conceptionense]KMV13573.1 hypothetical protein ACT17_34535 [Mycolicibacterium conceptionense]